MSCDVHVQDLLDKVRYEIDFSGFLGAAGIASAAWVVPAALTEASAGTSGKRAFNYLSNNTGVDGQSFEIKATITTDEVVPRKETHSFIVTLIDGCP